MTADDQLMVLGTLDALGMALADHDHQWTPEQRRGYENAVRILTQTGPPDIGERREDILGRVFA